MFLTLTSLPCGRASGKVTRRSTPVGSSHFYADTLKVSSGALIEVTLLFRYSTTDREATRVLALFGHMSEWQFN